MSPIARIAEQERRAVEVQTSISQKLESVGRLASGIAMKSTLPLNLSAIIFNFSRERLRR